MKRRTEITDRDKYVSKDARKSYKDDSDFYERWYAKFGKPQNRTMPAGEFMKRLKEMIDFE